MRLRLALLLVPLAGCGLSARADLAKIPPGTVVFDDACRLQPWFDRLRADPSLAPQHIQSMEMDGASGGGPAAGRDTFRFDKGPAREELEKVLAAHFTRIPPTLGRAKHVDVEITWARKAGVKRALTDKDGHLFLDGKSYSLPYHVCVGDLIYGETLYAFRATQLQ